MAETVKKATRESFGEALCELAEQNKDIVVFDTDLAAATKTSIFQEANPDRFFDCGIAEGNMMGVAAGMAAAGKIPVAASFAMFATGRAFEQIAAALDKAKTVKGKPTAILAKTVKGKGVSYMEDQVGWHGKAPNADEYKIAIEELNAQLKELEG